MTYDQLKQKLRELADKNQKFDIEDTAACMGVSSFILRKTCEILNINVYVDGKTDFFCGYKKEFKG